jgi:hypothetical protein
MSHLHSLLSQLTGATVDQVAGILHFSRMSEEALAELVADLDAMAAAPTAPAAEPVQEGHPQVAGKRQFSTPLPCGRVVTRTSHHAYQYAVTALGTWWRMPAGERAWCDPAYRTSMANARSAAAEMATDSRAVEVRILDVETGATLATFPGGQETAGAARKRRQAEERARKEAEKAERKARLRKYRLVICHRAADTSLSVTDQWGEDFFHAYVPHAEASAKVRELKEQFPGLKVETW